MYVTASKATAVVEDWEMQLQDSAFLVERALILADGIMLVGTNVGTRAALHPPPMPTNPMPGNTSDDQMDNRHSATTEPPVSAKVHPRVRLVAHKCL
jgi:hypothetical protein